MLLINRVVYRHVAAEVNHGTKRETKISPILAMRTRTRSHSNIIQQQRNIFLHRHAERFQGSRQAFLAQRGFNSVEIVIVCSFAVRTGANTTRGLRVYCVNTTRGLRLCCMARREACGCAACRVAQRSLQYSKAQRFSR